MSLQKLYVLDRASFLLDAQLLSSLSAGTFTGSSSSVLGTQSWNMPSTHKAVITIEQEQILVSGMSITGGTITCTIDTRGYNGTTAATHAAGSLIEIHLTKAHYDQLQDYLATLDDGGYIVQSAVTTIASATSHTISGDKTAIFTVGRVYLFKVSSTWYRALITAVSYGVPNTTITLLGDGLPAAGTVTAAGFEFNQSVNKAVDIELIKQVTNAPSVNPPSGYLFLWTKNGGWYSRDSSGNVRYLNIVTASVSSSGGVLTCDCSAANFFECTLTENITQVTWQNGTDGESYFIRFRQHASAAKTIALNTAGGTRFSNDIASYAVTSAVSAVDYLEFRFHGTDSKWDLTKVTQGFQTSPTAASGLPAGVMVPFGGSSVPSGWLLCDGTAVSRTTYSALFAAISTAYGTGDGSTTFNLPNMKGNVPIGYDSGQTEFNALGKTGGEKTHVLTTTEMPAHTHNIPGASGTSGGYPPATAQNSGGWTSGSAGSGGAHNNLQPYNTFNYIIKT
jgi:microcystin-dependent protein